MATEAESSPALPPRSPSPTPSQCDGEYWDPPCKICKKVDNEDNVLCELCNGAYHLACIEGNYSKGLPRVPTDDEWFCKGCVKRGIPETIIDRVGRGSSSFTSPSPDGCSSPARSQAPTAASRRCSAKSPPPCARTSG